MASLNKFVQENLNHRKKSGVQNADRSKPIQCKNHADKFIKRKASAFFVGKAGGKWGAHTGEVCPCTIGYHREYTFHQRGLFRGFPRIAGKWSTRQQSGRHLTTGVEPVAREGKFKPAGAQPLLSPSWIRAKTLKV